MRTHVCTPAERAWLGAHGLAFDGIYAQVAPYQGATGCAGMPPAMTRFQSEATIAAVSAAVLTPATCGVTHTRGCARSAWPGGSGSGDVTSSVADDRWPELSAARRPSVQSTFHRAFEVDRTCQRWTTHEHWHHARARPLACSPTHAVTTRTRHAHARAFRAWMRTLAPTDVDNTAARL